MFIRKYNKWFFAPADANSGAGAGSGDLPSGATAGLNTGAADRGAAPVGGDKSVDGSVGTGDKSNDKGAADGATQTAGAAETILGGGTGKTDANAPADGDKSKEGDGAEADTVPEDGQYKFEFPEGVTPNDGLLSAVQPIFKDLNIGQKAADKLVSAYVSAYQAEVEAQVKAHTDNVAGWVTSSKTDKEFGGAAFAASAAIANQTLDKFGTPELTKLLVDSGLSNHPEIVRLMYRVGKATGEDVAVPGDPSQKSDVPREAAWYKTTPNVKQG